jgi:hypothetical protein
MVPEKQVKQVEEANKTLIENTVLIPLGKKQVDILKNILEEKAKLQSQYAILEKQEGNLITFAIEFKGIDETKIQQVRLSNAQDSLVVLLRPDTPEEKKEV